jgi:hypothetical protein
MLPQKTVKRKGKAESFEKFPVGMAFFGRSVYNGGVNYCLAHMRAN